MDGLIDATASYKLLVFFRPDREEYGAWLARTGPAGELSVVARLEDHASHPGLHVHAECVREVLPPVGRQVYPGLLKAPRNGGRRRGGFTEIEALSLAYTFFRIDTSGEGSLL